MISNANDFANVAKDVPGILDLILHSRTQQCKMVNFQSSAPQQMECNHEKSDGVDPVCYFFCFVNYTPNVFILREQEVEKLNCSVKF